MVLAIIWCVAGFVNFTGGDPFREDLIITLLFLVLFMLDGEEKES